MPPVGIIAEYNPLHSGHLYHITETKKAFPRDGVICVMSGNFTQRGEPAIMNKNSRARQAIAAGADIVFELPVCYVLGPAEVFARAGVGLLAATGMVSDLSFGSEAGDVRPLEAAARAAEGRSYREAVAERMKEGLPYAEACACALPDGLSALLSRPNNLLGVEYIRAIRDLSADISPFTVKRRGASHDQADLSENFPSAGALRTAFLRGTPLPPDALPDFSLDEIAAETAAGRFPVRNSRLCAALMAKLRTTDAAELAQLADVSEGLENRISEAASTFTNPEAVINGIKTRRYTRARISRIMAQALIGITKPLQRTPLPYLRLLAANGLGCLMLKRMSGKASLPIVTKPADINGLSPAAKAAAAAECRADDIYSLLYPDDAQRTGGSFFTISPTIV